MKTSLSQTNRGGWLVFMPLPVILIDWSRNYRAVTFGWLIWLFQIYTNNYKGQP